MEEVNGIVIESPAIEITVTKRKKKWFQYCPINRAKLNRCAISTLTIVKKYSSHQRWL